jgi:phenylpropionate dioxygenase-like ring-hydroxylating dioxygenase large terminal subunit
MLSRENNELLCRVGRGTPMGNLMRQYWIPALPSREFPKAGGRPMRMMLLGERLVMFRDSNGRMGAVAEFCPHRGASLSFARSEEGGIRCAYHGWKFSVTGKCLDVPTEQRDRRERFASTIKARAYPCHEVNKMVWVYMGPRETPPPFPQFEMNTLPEENVSEPLIMMEQANWMQNLEGDLDSAHLDWVHRRLEENSEPPSVGLPGFWNPSGEPPVLDVVPTDYGVYYSARRRMPDGDDWHRVNQFIFPFFTMITTGDGSVSLRCFVPLDDHHAMLISRSGFPNRPIKPEDVARFGDHFADVGGYIERTSDPRTYYMTKANKTNDYNWDQKLADEKMFVGIPFVANLQDRAMTELMTDDDGQPLYDRTKEHLSASDAMIVNVRRQLIEAAIRLRDHNEVPANVDDMEMSRIRCATLKLPQGADWKALSEEARAVQEGKPSRSDLFIIQGLKTKEAEPA